MGLGPEFNLKNKILPSPTCLIITEWIALKQVWNK